MIINANERITQDSIEQLIQRHQGWLNHLNGFTKDDMLYLKNCCISKLDLNRANLRRATFRNCIFTGTDISFSNLRDARFIHCEFHDVNFAHSDMRCIRFDTSKIKFVTFNSCDLTEAKFDDTWITSSQFKNACLRKASFRNVDFCFANFAHAELDSAKFPGFRHMYGTIFTDTDIEKTMYHENTFTNPGCPSDGSFIAWYYATIPQNGAHVLVKMLVPEDAIRVSTMSEYIRFNKSKVQQIVMLGFDKNRELGYIDLKDREVEMEPSNGNIIKVKVGDELCFDEFDPDITLTRKAHQSKYGLIGVLSKQVAEEICAYREQERMEALMMN